MAADRIETKEEELLAADEVEDMMLAVPDWSLSDNALEREFSFGGFRQAMDFVNKIADVAEKMDHHPDICTYYDKVHLKITTHKAGGLTQDDFELAAAIDRIQA